MVFIIIDGLDGSGKSTQAEMLCNKVAMQSKSYIVRDHPSEDNFFGRHGKGYLLVEGRSAKIAASFFYMLDVLRSIIIYKWRNADYVVFVRYLMGTAYLPEPLHKVAYFFFYWLVPRSKYMFFIDVSPEKAYRRIEKRANRRREVFESLEKLYEVRKKVRGLTLNSEWIILNGDASMHVIHEEIIGFLGL
jgi:dTMP kinase